MFKYIFALIFFLNTFNTMAQSIEKPYHHITKTESYLLLEIQKVALKEIQILSGNGKFLAKKKRNLK